MPTRSAPRKGLRLFLDDAQQEAWLDGASLPDGERPEQSLELRFKFAGRVEKLRRLPQADDVLDILAVYAATALPVSRLTERFFWSVSCLPSTDKTLARINASWMELFALQPDGDGLRARFVLHLSDFTSDGSATPEQLDLELLERLAGDSVTHHFWKASTFVVKACGAAAIRSFLADPDGLHAIRRFNLTHLNRGRNAYQASHCYSLADVMLGDDGATG